MQEHHARSHHFDFRLEMDGVLVSWAVPKGIPETKAAKRLAVHVEDHPLEYGSFEGEIPAGNYGAGTVAIWDRGTWTPLDQDWKKSFRKGKLKFTLAGERLRGAFVLARMGEEPNWLLRRIGEAGEADPDPVEAREGARFVAPQLARVVSSVPATREWVHEIKLDGYRIIAVKREGEVRLFTRNQHDWTDRFGRLAKALEKVTRADFVLDGEAVVFDEQGRTSFGALQEALSDGGSDDIVYVAFDLLHLGGRNLRELPLSERIERLAGLIPEEGGTVRRSRVWPPETGPELYKQSCKLGLEGILSKSRKGRYLEGQRKDWVKSKCRPRQEFAVCGYTPPKGTVPGFGALVLGSHEGGRWVSRGKVGTGFSDAQRRRLQERFKKLRTREALFPMKEEVQWLRPELVAEIEFTEITREGSIRQGSFVALREDKDATDIVLESSKPIVSRKGEVIVAGVKISHPDRLVYPADGISKAEVAAYYESIADWILPEVADRPLAVIRAPEGIDGELFFQKSFPKHVPDGVNAKVLDDGTKIFTIRDVEGLVSLAQFGVIEFHPWGSTLPKEDKPDRLIWDLDPDPAISHEEVLGTALLLRDYLRGHDLPPLLKTSGGKGYHLVLPIRRKHGWEVMKPFSKAVAEAVAAMNPRKLVTTSTKAKRKGRIFIDWMRNGRGATCIAAWSVRARPGAAISAPIAWSELRGTLPDQHTLRSPLRMPREWEERKPLNVPVALLREFGVPGR